MTKQGFINILDMKFRLENYGKPKVLKRKLVKWKPTNNMDSKNLEDSSGNLLTVINK